MLSFDLYIELSRTEQKWPESCYLRNDVCASMYPNSLVYN